MVTASATSVTLSVGHKTSAGAPYAYDVAQEIAVRARALSLSLSVMNTGAFALPFGLGHHLFLPLTAATTLQAPAAGYWSEKHDYLPDRRMAPPADLDFATPCGLPSRWINNGFDGRGGKAAIAWPEHRLALKIEADPPFNRYFLFRSDVAFEPSFRGDYFCFEPMTHDVNGQNLASGGGLVRLAPGETLTTRVRLRPTPMERAP